MSIFSPVQLQALQQAAARSVACEQATGLPAEVSVAQWALESAWGARQPGNNCFGIKAYQGCFGVQLLNTTEVLHGERVPVTEQFATFPDLEACFEKHAQLLTTREGPYTAAWSRYQQTRDLETFIRQVSAVYSTNPSYAAVLLSIIAMPAVQQAIAESGLNT